jgi:hypothetical protein
MRYLFIVAIALVSGITHPVFGFEQHLDGFQGTKWGMSEQQVQEVFEGKLVNAVIPGSPSKILKLKHYNIDECNVYLDFYFDAAKLSRVGLHLNDETQIQCPDGSSRCPRLVNIGQYVV